MFLWVLICFICCRWELTPGIHKLLQAVSSCASDATYHVMWIILFTALDDFGIKELNSGITHHSLAEIDVVRRKVADEALHGALRIAGLAGVLTSNGYLVSV